MIFKTYFIYYSKVLFQKLYVLFQKEPLRHYNSQLVLPVNDLKCFIKKPMLK